MYVHLLTCSEMPDLYEDDRVFRSVLECRGHRTTVGVWGTAADISPETVTVVRSCWDYWRDSGRFLDYLEGLPGPVWNPPALIRWNSCKNHYLRELHREGVAIVPTNFDGWTEGLPASDELIIKSSISNAGLDVRRVNRAEFEAGKRGGWGLYLIQPFLPEIVNGEFSVIYLGGSYSHCVHKVPADGEFRVQHFYGGRYQRIEPSPALYEAAALAMLAVPHPTLYARLDFIPDQGRYLLGEMELIEPLLHFDLCPEAAHRAVDVLESYHLGTDLAV
jgi:glutathione synthase/RimK-type ligase-like ATP-grasp enzyme